MRANLGSAVGLYDQGYLPVFVIVSFLLRIFANWGTEHDVRTRCDVHTYKIVITVASPYRRSGTFPRVESHELWKILQISNVTRREKFNNLLKILVGSKVRLEGGRVKLAVCACESIARMKKDENRTDAGEKPVIPSNLPYISSN